MTEKEILGIHIIEFSSPDDGGDYDAADWAQGMAAGLAAQTGFLEREILEKSTFEIIRVKPGRPKTDHSKRRRKQQPKAAPK